jgi:hypothetical protein
MGYVQPPDGKFLAEQIVAYTKIDVNPKNPQPGETMTIETIPGIFPIIPSQLSGALNIPVTGPLDVVLATLVRAVQFTVRYKIVVNGTTVSSLTLEPLTPMSLPDSDPLMAMFRVAPPLVPEHKAHTPSKAELIATVKVVIESNTVEKDVKIPLELTAIPLPTLLVLKSDPNDPDWPSNKVFVMTRLGSQLTSVSDTVSSLNAAIQVLNSVKDIFGWGTAFDLLLGGLGDALGLIVDAGSVAGFAIEEAPDLDDFDDFDDEARSSVLFGPVGTSVKFFSGEEYNGLAAGEDEESTFTITDDFGAAQGITTGFGIHKEPDWYGRGWDTDSSDNMNDMESCKFTA